MTEENQFMQEAELIEIVENQLEDGNPIKVTGRPHECLVFRHLTQAST